MENGVRFSMGWDLVMPGVKEENPSHPGLLDLSRPPRSSKSRERFRPIAHGARFVPGDVRLGRACRPRRPGGASSCE